MAFARVLSRIFLLHILLVLSWSVASAQSEGTPQQLPAYNSYTISPISNLSACMDLADESAATSSAVQSYGCTMTSQFWKSIPATVTQAWTVTPITTANGTAYEIVNADNGSCLNVQGGSWADGTPIIQWQCTGSNNELWQFYQFESTYELVSVGSGKCLDLPGGVSSNGTQLQQWSCGQGNNDNQLWNLTFLLNNQVLQQLPANSSYTISPISNASACAAGNGASVQSASCNGTLAQSWAPVPTTTDDGIRYEFVNKNSGACLTKTGDPETSGMLVSQSQCLGQDNQLWALLLTGPGYVMLSEDGGCLSLPNGDSSNGINLDQEGCPQNNSLSNQLWTLRASGLAAGPYKLSPTLNASACMDVSGASTLNGAIVDTYSCNNRIAQSWTFVPVATNSGTAYQLIPGNSGLCLDVTGYSLANGAPIQQWQCGNAQTNQLWQFYLFGTAYEIVSLSSGKCLDMPTGNTTSGIQIDQKDCNQGNSDELWTVQLGEGSLQQNLAAGPYTLHPESTSFCINVSGGSTANGTVVQTQQCSGNPSESWTLVPVSTGNGTAYELLAGNSGSCLDVNNYSIADGGQIQQWQCSGVQPNQFWQFYQFGSAYELVSVNSGKCLDLPNGNPSSGIQLDQNDCGQGINANELWSLQPNVTLASTTTTFSVNPSTAPAATPIALSGMVIPSSATGTATFLDGSVVIGSASLDTSGFASISVSTLSQGNHLLSAHYGGDSNYSSSSSPPIAFVVTAAQPSNPTISSIVPASGYPGDHPITVRGSGFGPTAGQLSLNSGSVTPVKWSDTQVTFAVPQGAASGSITITNGNSQVSNAVNFTVLQRATSSCPVQP